MRIGAARRPAGRPSRTKRAGLAATVLVLLGAGCRASAALDGTAAATPPPAFDAALARAHLDNWLAQPRALGDPRRAESIARLVATLAAMGVTPERVDHVADDPGGTGSYALTEIVADFRPDAARRFVLATHYDVRPWADEDPDPANHARPIPGANDGTSGLAVVLALVPPLLAALPPDVGVSVVLFDGEELGRPDAGGYCMGSRHLAERIRQGLHPTLARAELGIVLDMVGDADLRLRIEPNSSAFHPVLARALWDTAAALGEPAFSPDASGPGIVDDHQFLTAAGIPSVLVIDREYVAWHRVDDDAQHVATASLASVGRVVLATLLQWFAPPR